MKLINTSEKKKYTTPINLLILWTLGLILISLTYFLLHTKLIFYDLLFWIGVLTSGVSTYFIISSDYKINIKLIFLFLFGFVLYLPHALASPNYFHIYDELRHYQTTLLIYETGSLDVTLTSFEISKYYPGLEILTVFLKNITGDSIFKSGILIIGIIHSFIAIFLYLFFKQISSAKIAAIGTFAYFFNGSYTYFNTYFSYESIGLPLLVLFLFTVSYRNLPTNQIKIAFIQIILLVAIVITHHYSSYMLLLFLIVLLIIQIIYDYINIKIYDRKTHKLTFLAATLIFGWMLYVATITITYYNNMFKDAVKGVFKLSLFEERTSEFMSTQLLDVPYYELFTRRFLYVPLILILVIIGVYYLYTKKSLRNEYILTLTIFSTLFWISLLGAFTSSIEFGRFATFGFIGVAFLIGVSLERMQKNRFLKVISLISIILLLIGGVSIGTSPPHRGAYSADIRIGQQTITADVISSAAWSEKYLGRYNLMLSDRANSNVFDFYGIQKSRSYRGWEVFFPVNVSFDILYYLKISKIEYLVADERITRFISEVRYYFDREELSIENHPPYGRTEPLPGESIKKFNRHPAFSNIYDNGNINIYKIIIKI